MNAQELIDQENKLKELWEAGEISHLLHLQGGNEDQIIEIFKDVKPTDWVCASHRCHYAYSLHGGTDLIEKVLAGKSMFLYSPRFICSAIVGGMCSIACGIALSIAQKGTQERVWCLVGDGATDQGAFWEAVRFAEGRNLPITFVVEDNGGQCGVSPETRWGGRIPMMKAILDSPKVRYYRYTPRWPHAGATDELGNPTRPKLKWKR